MGVELWQNESWECQQTRGQSDTMIVVGICNHFGCYRHDNILAQPRDIHTRLRVTYIAFVALEGLQPSLKTF